MGKYQFSYEEKITIIREHEENHKTLKAICEEYDISKAICVTFFATTVKKARNR